MDRLELISKYRNRYLYKRFLDDKNYCFEVIKLKNGKYPSNEDFGIGLYGICISNRDRNLDSKIDFYLKNGLKRRYENQ